MNYADILKECLQNPFSIENYRKFIVNFLNGTQLREISGLRSADIFAEYSFYVEGFALIANYVDPKGKRVGIFAVKLKKGRDIEKARNKQRNFIARLIVDNNLDAALAAFYLNEETKWRLSFVRLDYEFVKGKIKQNLTPAKRYSYLVGKDEPCHTALESLLPIFESENFRPIVDSIEQAFNVEKVTKQFFEKYKEKYLELADYLESIPCFEEEAHTRGFTTEQFAKKLMGQIVFMYFLQKKGWLGVKAIKQTITAKEFKNLFWYNAKTREFAPRIYTQTDENTYKLNQSALASLSDEEEKLIAMAIKGEPWGTGPRTFMRDLFNFAMKKKANFFDDYLEPLFYEGMNCQRDADNYYPRLHCRIPFLNGGLFEELGHYDWRNNAFHIPNEMFSNAHTKEDPREADGILDIFDRYNFTINEDEPLEKEVAVDPEMLGKIFENLLDVKDRKSKGAFYTPREIVHYMCQESLINYIVNTVGSSYEATKDFVLYGDIMKDEDCSREGTYGFLPEMLMPDCIYQNLQAIDNALADVRVADPAVGSGAFPMGMLSEIVKLREIITEYMARELCLRPEFRGVEKMGALKAAIWKLRNEQRNSYKLKKETMRNSIYAVDIEPSAVDIAKLRLWLTLVVEQEIDPNDPENDSPLTLPNLDCNVMCGNSLIDEFEGIDLSLNNIVSGDKGQGTFWDSGIDTALERLFAAQRDYFYADNRDKKMKCANLIEQIKERLLDYVFTSAGAEKRARFDKANAEASTPFFLWKLNFAKVFKEKGGFDIVIGNPPYLKEMDNKSIFAPVVATSFGKKWHTGKMDYWYFFAFKAFSILSKCGQLCFIAANYFASSEGGQKFNNYIINNTHLIQYIDFGKMMIFETADVQTMILIASKSLGEDRSCSIYQFTDADRTQLQYDLRNLARSERVVYKRIADQKILLDSSDHLVFETDSVGELLNKILRQKSTQTLIKATQGIVENPKDVNASIIKKLSAANVDLSEIHLGDEVFVIHKNKIDSYGFNDAEKKFLREYHYPNEIRRYYCTNNFDYYLLYLTRDTVRDITQYPNLYRHLIKYKPIMDQRRETQNGSNMWFHLHWGRKESIFFEEKIVYPQMCAIPTFGYTNEPYFINMSSNLICAQERGVNLQCLTAILNSSLGRFWLYKKAKKRGVNIDISVAVINDFPINEAILADKCLCDLSAGIIEAARSGADTAVLETQIDKRIYDLYNLTPEEIALVENTVK